MKTLTNTARYTAIILLALTATFATVWHTEGACYKRVPTFACIGDNVPCHIGCETTGTNCPSKRIEFSGNYAYTAEEGNFWITPESGNYPVTQIYCYWEHECKKNTNLDSECDGIIWYDCDSSTELFYCEDCSTVGTEVHQAAYSVTNTTSCPG